MNCFIDVYDYVSNYVLLLLSISKHIHNFTDTNIASVVLCCVVATTIFFNFPENNLLIHNRDS